MAPKVNRVNEELLESWEICRSEEVLLLFWFAVYLLVCFGLVWWFILIFSFCFFLGGGHCTGEGRI